jgi:hypothetical protein
MKPDVIFIPGFWAGGEPNAQLGQRYGAPRQPDSVEIPKN